MHVSDFARSVLFYESAPATELHLCFHARSRTEVDAFHRSGTDAGFRSNGGPGLRDVGDPGHPG